MDFRRMKTIFPYMNVHLIMRNLENSNIFFKLRNFFSMPILIFWEPNLYTSRILYIIVNIVLHLLNYLTFVQLIRP